VNEFYQDKLVALSEELQQRFHEQVSETDDPDLLLDRIIEEADMIRLAGVDWDLGRRTGMLVRALRDSNDVVLHVGQRVLLAGDGSRDSVGVVEELTDDGAIMCRVVEETQ
jgi:hypothetical protein